jgi:hypothetical protein
VWTGLAIPEQPKNFVITTLIAIILLIILGCFNTSSSRGVRNLQALIEEYQTDELLFDVEFRHPWCRVDFCSLNRIDYHEITENQIENGLENQTDENSNNTSESVPTSDRRYSAVESQPVISNAEEAPLILN